MSGVFAVVARLLFVATLAAIVVSSFISTPAFAMPRRLLLDLAVVLAAFAWLPATLELLRHRLQRWRSGGEGSAIDLAGLGVGLAVVLGATLVGGALGPASEWLYEYVYSALSMAVHAVIGFALATALLRAAARGGAEALVFVCAALVVLVGEVAIVRGLPWMATGEFIFRQVLVTPGQRAIVVGAALAAVFMMARWAVGRGALFGRDHG